MIRKKLRRIFRKFQYIHPSQRHVLVIIACFWLSIVALWTIPTKKSPHGYVEGFINFRIDLKLQFDKFFAPKCQFYYKKREKRM